MMRVMCGLAAALALGLAAPALAGEGRTVSAAVNPIEHDKDGDVCQATFAVAIDPATLGAQPLVAGGAIGVFGGEHAGLMLKLGLSTGDSAPVEPASAVVLTAAGDNAAAQFHADSSDSDPGYRLFMFTIDQPVYDALSRSPIRLAYTMKEGGPRTVIAIDLTRTEDAAKTDPAGPQRFADCLKALR